MTLSLNKTTLLLFVPFLMMSSRSTATVVPGTGTFISHVGDNFEDPNWSFVHNHPKSSQETSFSENGSGGGRKGRSVNGRWFEGPKRGQPDTLRVVATPEGGLEGSRGSLLMQTLNSGIPGRISNQTEQDDLIVNCTSRLKTNIRPSETPNFVVRVFLPPPEFWENRSGPHFGLRAGCSATATKTTGGFFGGGKTTNEPYWPGMWIHFRSETSKNQDKDSAFLKVRGDRLGRDFFVRELDQFGWWTFGMSITPDGQVHYYASPGVDPLTPEDHLTSQYPYSYRALSFRTFFFNVCNRNDGHSRSTPFVIDDPQLYLVQADRVAGILQRDIDRKARIAAAKKARAEKIAQQRQLAIKRAEERKQAQAERRAKMKKQVSSQKSRSPTAQKSNQRRRGVNSQNHKSARQGSQSRRR